MDHIVIYILLLFLSGSAKAISDTVLFWWKSSIFSKHPGIFNPQWWNPRLSHTNKDKASNYFFKLLKQTFLVTYTDAWHFFEMIQAATLVLCATLLHYYGLDMFGFGGWWSSEILDVIVTFFASYAIRMCGNTFTKAAIKDRSHIG